LKVFFRIRASPPPEPSAITPFPPRRHATCHTTSCLFATLLSCRHAFSPATARHSEQQHVSFMPAGHRHTMPVRRQQEICRCALSVDATNARACMPVCSIAVPASPCREVAFAHAAFTARTAYRSATFGAYAPHGATAAHIAAVFIEMSSPSRRRHAVTANAETPRVIVTSTAESRSF